MNRGIVVVVAVGWLLAVVGVLSGAEPTGERDWKSTAGTTIRAVVTGVSGSNVELKTSDGRALAVSMDKFVAEDQAFLREHFGIEEVPAMAGEAAPAAGSEAGPAEGLAHSTGEVVGPVSAGGDTEYMVYLPSTLKAGRKAPLLFFTSAGGGGKSVVNKMVDGAELNGWIAACSMNSRNGESTDHNYGHSKESVEHIIDTLPVDEDRVYFTGGSGGGAMSMYNAGKMKHAGTITMIGYLPSGTSVSGGDYVFINGATDYNRYTSANARSSVGKSSIHFFHPGGHNMGPDWIMTDAICWLNGRYLSTDGDGLDAERLDYEASMIEWIGELRSSEPWRAYYWALYLKEDYEIESANRAAVEDLVSELGADGVNVKYAAGIGAIDEFAQSKLQGITSGSSFGHTTPGIQGAAEKLAEEYAGVPHIEETAKALMEPTVGQGKKKK